MGAVDGGVVVAFKVLFLLVATSLPLEKRSKDLHRSGEYFESEDEWCLTAVAARATIAGGIMSFGASTRESLNSLMARWPTEDGVLKKAAFKVSMIAGCWYGTSVCGMYS